MTENKLFVQLFSVIVLIALNLFPVLVLSDEVVCPPADTYSPCTCYDYAGYSGNILLSCYASLNDSMASDILDVFLKTPGVSPLGGVDFSQSELTRVPHQIKIFPGLKYLNLASNNLQSIETDDFSNAQTKLKNLWFQNNQIETIAPFAFKSESYFRIGLSWNNLARLESTVFKSVLEKIIATGGDPLGYIDLGELDFDCDCHLAWLLRDNRHLLTAINMGLCNGTELESVEPNLFKDCPTFVCPLGYDGYYEDPLNSIGFYQCEDNNAYHYLCPENSAFNQEIGRCNENNGATATITLGFNLIAFSVGVLSLNFF